MSEVEITRCEGLPLEMAWLVAFRSRNTTAFRHATSSIGRMSGHEAHWNPEDHAWRVSWEGMMKLERRWPQIAAVQRERMERARARLRGEEYHAPVVPALVPDRVVQAFEELHIAPTAPVELVKAARKAWARLLHPDRAGGDLERMQRINDAADIAEEWAKQHAPEAPSGAA